MKAEELAVLLAESLAKLVGTSTEDVLAGLRQFITDKEQEALA